MAPIVVLAGAVVGALIASFLYHTFAYTPGGPNELGSPEALKAGLGLGALAGLGVCVWIGSLLFKK